MANLQNSINQVYVLETLSSGTTCIHKLHPMVKFIATFAFIIIIVSFDRYAFGRMLPYIFYTQIVMALAEIPFTLLFKRYLVAVPFCLFAGISNVIFDRATAFSMGGLTVSYGVVSLFTILFRAYLCIIALLILVGTTPFAQLAAQMRRLKLPDIFVTVFEMIYRYIGVLVQEAHSMNLAYALRSNGRKAIEFRHIGSFLGQLLLRSIDRAERVYAAMKCRGYAMRDFSRARQKVRINDVIYLLVVIIMCLFFRLFSVGYFL
jgi:cobalt/nickel transport system permease protein